MCYRISPPYDRNKLFSFVDSLLPDISVEIHDQKIEIVYDARFVTPEAIEKLFTDADFVLNRDTPFEREFSLLNKIVNIIFTVFSPFVWVIFKLIDLVFRLSKDKKKH